MYEIEVHFLDITKIIKDVTSSTSHKKNPFLRPRIKKNLPSTFFYEPIFIKVYMNANIVKTQIYGV